jgi:superfamily II DNA or RNA helicase
MVKIKVSRNAIAYNVPTPILKEIKKDMEVLNPKWLDAKKMGRWNGHIPKYIKAYKEKGDSLLMPISYVENLMQALTKNEIKFGLIDLRKEIPAKFKWNGKLRPFQEKACAEMLEYSNGTLEAATGAGKTVMGLWLMAARAQRSLIIVHTKELSDQWFDRMQQFLDIKREEIGQIGQSKFRIGRRVTVGMVQSLYKRVRELSDTFGMVMVDECHRAPSRTFTEAIGGLNSKYKIGLTATPYRRDNLTQFIFWYVGPIRHKVQREGLFERGDIVNPEFILVGTKCKSNFSAVFEYTSVISDLCKNELRNSMIVEEVSKFDKSGGSACLLLSDRKNHCRILQKMLETKYGIHSVMLTSDIPMVERKRIVDKINSGEI